MSNDDLIDLMTEKILSGNSDTTAANVRELITAMIESFQNLDEKDSNSGYAGLNSIGKVDASKLAVAMVDQVGRYLRDDGSFVFADTVKTDDNSLTMDVFTKHYVFNGTTATWQTQLVKGNNVRSITNIGIGILTINYPGGSPKIINIASSLTPVNTIAVSSASKYTIIDNGTFLIFI